MKRKDRTRGSRFEITEKTLPLCARDGSDLQDPLSALQQDIGGLMKKLADARQALSESERLHQEQVELILHSILEVIDAFDRIFSSVDKKKEQITGQMKVWLGNFRTVSRLVRRILDAEGVVPIENLDEGFDPRWHKVAETLADPLKANGSIVEVVRKGYVWKGHVLRKAEVIVVRNAGETEAAPENPVAAPKTRLPEKGEGMESEPDG